MQTYCICVQSILVLPFAISGWFWIAFENLLGIFCCWNTFRSPVMDIKSYISTLSKIGQWTDKNRIELGIIGSINKPTPPYDVWLTLHFAGKAKGIGNHIFIFTIPFMSVVNKLWLETIMHMACSFLIKYILEEILPKHHEHEFVQKFDPEDITWVPGNGLCFPTTARKVELKSVLIFQCLSCNERKLSITKVWWSANQWIV